MTWWCYAAAAAGGAIAAVIGFRAGRRAGRRESLADAGDLVTWHRANGQVLLCRELAPPTCCCCDRPATTREYGIPLCDHHRAVGPLEHDPAG